MFAAPPGDTQRPNTTGCSGGALQRRAGGEPHRTHRTRPPIRRTNEGFERNVPEAMRDSGSRPQRG